MERRLFEIDAIFISKNRRAPDMARVKSIAESIGDVAKSVGGNGLMNPPAVCIRDNVMLDDGEVCDAVPVLIYGHHRLLALKQRGEVAVECVVFDVNDLQAELLEIDENLARSELSAAEESACILRRQEIWRKINGFDGEETARNSRSLGGRGHKDFASDVAAVIGGGRNPESVKRDVQLKIARARELGPDINRVVGTSLDKGVELDALVKLPGPDRESIIARAEAGEQVSARPPKEEKPVDALTAFNVIVNSAPAPDEDEEEQQFWQYWASLRPATRRKLLAQLGAMSKAA